MRTAQIQMELSRFRQEPIPELSRDCKKRPSCWFPDRLEEVNQYRVTVATGWILTIIERDCVKSE